MTASTLVLPIGWRALDTNGKPISGAQIKFYRAGTTTPATVYSDSGLLTALGTVVGCDSGGAPVSGGGAPTQIYTGSGAYKVVVTDSGGTTIPALGGDNISGALVIPDASAVALPQMPVIYKTSSYSVTLADRGKLINADPTGGSFAITLPSAVAVGDNFAIGIRHNGTSTTNIVTIRTVSSQTISGPSVAAASAVPLSALGHAYWLVSDGAGWTVAESVRAISGGPLTIVSRVAAPPSSPVGGQRYIINGTPSGIWSTLGFSDKNVVESDGNGSWIGYAPQDGWLAYVVGETLLTQYRAGSWVDLTNITPPAVSYLKMAVFSDVKAQNTAGGTPTANAWTDAVLNTTGTDTIGTTLATNAVTLPAGTYLVMAGKQFFRTNASNIRLYNVTGSAEICRSFQADASSYASGGAQIDTPSTVTLFNTFTLTVASQVKLQYFVTTAGGSGLGIARNIAGETEKYAEVMFLDVSSLQGPRGAQGIQGVDGLDAAYSYQWTTSTSGDPGSGKIGANNATLTSVTQINISKTDTYGAGLGAVIATWDDSTSSVKARIKISKEGATQNFAEFTITGTGTDNTTYWTFPASYLASGGVITTSDNLAVLVLEKGDKGDTGLTGSTGASGAPGAQGNPGLGSGYTYAFDTSVTMSAPLSGGLRLNNATLASVTALAIATTTAEIGNPSVASSIATWDQSTTSAHRARLLIKKFTAPQNFVEFDITGASTNNSTWYQLAVTYVAGSGSFSASDQLSVEWRRTGDAGLNGTGTGSVTSVGLTMPGEFSVSGSPITVAGTLAVTRTNQTANTVLSGPSTGVPASPTFRALVATDIPTLSYAPQTSGTSILKGNGTGGFSSAAAGTDYQSPIGTISGIAKGNGANALTAATAGTDYMHPGTTSTVTVGFTVTPNSLGTVTTGTVTPAPASGNYQYYTNNGAHTLAAPAADCAIDILVTNGATAGAITFSGFTVGASTGSAYATTNAQKYILSIRRINGVSTYSWYGLQ